MAKSNKSDFNFQDWVITAVIAILIRIVLEQVFQMWPDGFLPGLLSFVGLLVITEVIYAKLTHKKYVLID